MAILFVGNSIHDLDGPITNFTGTAQTRDTNYSPEEIAGAVHDTDTRYLRLEPELTGPADSGTMWIHFRYQRPPFYSNGGADGYILTVFDANGDQIAAISLLDGQFGAESHGDSVVAGTYDSQSADSTIDFKIVVGANIDTTLYEDGASVSTATAANTGGKGDPAFVRLDFYDTVGLSGSGGTLYLSEIMITDNEDTTGWRLADLVPDATGNYSDFDGDYTKLADGSRVTGAASQIPNDRLSSGVSAYNGAATPSSIRAVIAKTAAKASLSPGPGAAEQFLRIGSTDYPGTAQDLSQKMTRVMDIWDNNPSDAAAWEVSDLSTFEVGIRTLPGAWTPITETDTITSGAFVLSNLDFSGLIAVRFIILGLTVTTDDSEVKVRLHQSGAAVTTTIYQWDTGEDSSSDTSTIDGGAGADHAKLIGATAAWGVGNASNKKYSGIITVYAPDSDSVFKLADVLGSLNAPSDALVQHVGGFNFADTNPIDGATIYADSDCTGGLIRAEGI